MKQKSFNFIDYLKTVVKIEEDILKMNLKGYMYGKLRKGKMLNELEHK